MRNRARQVTAPMDGFVRRLAKSSVLFLSLVVPLTMIG